MPETAKALAPLPFEAFLAVLVSHGFPIGVEHRARLHRLLEDLEPDLPPGRLKTVLCPMLASNDAQQETFHRLFEQFFPELREGDDQETGWRAPVTAAPRRTRRVWVIVFANLLWLSVVAYTGWRFGGFHGAAQPAAASKPNERGGSTVDPVFPRGSDYAAKLQGAPPATLSVPAMFLRLLPYILVLGLAIFELTSWLRREAILNRTPQKDPPSRWPRGPGSRGARRIYGGTELARVARRLRTRETVESGEVDVPGTITQTVRRLGFVKFAFGFGSRRPEYLALIERQSSEDHLAALFQELTESLRREGVLLNTYFYAGDAHVCLAAADSAPVFLEDLCARYRDRRAVVFGDGAEFSNPYADEPSRTRAALRSLRDCGLLSPTAGRTRRERELTEAGIPVLPATIEGLWRLALTWGNGKTPAGGGGIEVTTREPAWQELQWKEKLPEYVASLQAHLGEPLFQWLCGCAVHSQLHWELTLAIGDAIQGVTEHEGNVLRLSRLRWFRLGGMPVGLREELVRKLDRKTASRVREVVLKFLETHAAPRGSFAETAQKADIAGHQWELSPEQANRIHESRELTRLLAESKPTSLGLILPGRIRDWLFRQSVPAFGLRPGVRAALAGASVALVAIGTFGITAMAHVGELRELPMAWSSQFRKAAESLKGCQPAHPPRFATASGYAESGSLYFEENNFACAIQAFSLAIRLNPQLAVAYVGRAAAALRSEPTLVPAGAKEDLEQAIRLDARISRAYYWRGTGFAREGNFKEALKMGNEAAQLDPTDAYPHNLLGRTLHGMGRDDEAIREYAEAVRLSPHWEVPHNNIGAIYFDQGKYDAAIKEFRIAAQMNPAFTLATVNEAKALWHLKRFGECIAKDTDVIRVNPDSRDAHLSRASCYERQDDLENAWLDADFIVKHSPDADAFVLRGNYEHKLQRDTEALADYSESIRRKPDYGLAYYDRAFVYRLLGRDGEAAADYRQVLKLPGPAERKEDAEKALRAMDKFP